MAISFNQSTRALQSDREWASLLIATSALGLLLLWLAWFLWAPVSLYETGVLVGVTRRGLVVANFPVQATERLRQGQLALLRVQDDTESASLSPSAQQAVAAVVMSVDSDVRADVIEVTLSTLSAQWPAATLSTGYPVSGSVAVDVGQVTPAQLLWRASTQGGDTGAVLLSPASP